MENNAGAVTKRRNDALRYAKNRVRGRRKVEHRRVRTENIFTELRCGRVGIRKVHGVGVLEGLEEIVLHLIVDHGRGRGLNIVVVEANITDRLRGRGVGGSMDRRG